MLIAHKKPVKTPHSDSQVKALSKADLVPKKSTPRESLTPLKRTQMLRHIG